VRGRAATHRDQAYLVTEASPGRSAEINQRQRTYLVMMGVRLVCFVLTVVLFVNHGGWLTVIPAVGAIALPYFAVVVANSRRPGDTSGFQPYLERLPDRFSPDASSEQARGPASPPSGQSDQQS
jgi:hypothetical protein